MGQRYQVRARSRSKGPTASDALSMQTGAPEPFTTRFWAQKSLWIRPISTRVGCWSSAVRSAVCWVRASIRPASRSSPRSRSSRASSASTPPALASTGPGTGVACSSPNMRPQRRSSSGRETPGVSRVRPSIHSASWASPRAARMRGYPAPSAGRRRRRRSPCWRLLRRRPFSRLPSAKSRRKARRTRTGEGSAVRSTIPTRGASRESTSEARSGPRRSRSPGSRFSLGEGSWLGTGVSRLAVGPLA